MTDGERCDVCGFEWDAVDPEDISGRVRSATSSFARTLLASPVESSIRPSEDRWSALEYGCHVRDVLFNLRDRLIFGAVDDEPVCHPMHGTPRVQLGLYSSDTPTVAAGDLDVAGELFARTWDTLDVELRQRRLVYSLLVGPRALTWVAAQALHETEHHLDDARQCIMVVSAGSPSTKDAGIELPD